MTETTEHKKFLVILSCFIALVCIFIGSLPKFYSDIQWVESISCSGSIASLGGIIIVILQTLNMKKATEAVKDAVIENKRAITKLITVNDVAKHLQMLREIEAYIRNSRWDVAHLRLGELLLILETISSNREKYKIERTKMSDCLANVKEDLRNLNKAIHNKEKIDILIIANHIDAIGPILNQVRTFLTSPDYDNAKV